jgi:predicted transcriptional regulator
MPRYNVEFSNEVNQALERLAEEQGGSKADVIRRAIALERWLAQVKEKGGRVLVEQDGQMSEVVRF